MALSTASNCLKHTNELISAAVHELKFNDPFSKDQRSATVPRDKSGHSGPPRYASCFLSRFRDPLFNGKRIKRKVGARLATEMSKILNTHSRASLASAGAYSTNRTFELSLSSCTMGLHACDVLLPTAKRCGQRQRSISTFSQSYTRDASWCCQTWSAAKCASVIQPSLHNRGRYPRPCIVSRSSHQQILQLLSSKNGKFGFDHQPRDGQVFTSSHGDTGEGAVKMRGLRRCLPLSTRMNYLPATSWQMCRGSR